MMVEKLAEIARQQNINIYSISQIENGIEKTVTVNPANDCNDIYSVSKNFTATAIGILYDNGLVDLNQNIYQIFSDEYPEIDTQWKAVKVRHVLTHTVGIETGFLDIDVEDIRTYGTHDFLKTVLAHVPALEPGTRFVYSDSNYYLASRIVEKKSGHELENFLNKELFLPLEFQGAAFTKCPLGHSMGATGLFLRTIDMAKLGQLYLNGGVWNGKRIISEEWIRLATSEKVKLPPNSFYGYSFTGDLGKTWFAGGGMYGQKILISRKYNRVIAWTSHEEDGSSERLMQILLSQEN